MVKNTKSAIFADKKLLKLLKGLTATSVGKSVPVVLLPVRPPMEPV
jgi:hypothetical protein